ncbi:hypothetical protein JHU38_07790 [Prevotella sp. A2931]|uniref:Lipoprotein n=1 Tax=Prevotella illustrans TaxID=2800387 RepID=A0ABS3M6A6_9BACT|nr:MULTISPECIES: hypothetical protein [Prevotella]MBO1363670.1 hypothetical protein [Prevotella illustrans]PTL26402.1 hypothetical protein C3V39_04655 [Prevotella sp. oral taxon 820]
MKKIKMMMAGLAVLLSSCSQTEVIKWTEARNYYHVGETRLPETMKITRQQTFDENFGMAAIMSKDGQPTPIDFNKDFVLAKIVPETDRQTTLQPLALKKVGDKLQLTYRYTQGARQSFTTRPFFLLIVPKAYEKLEIEEKMVDKE